MEKSQFFFQQGYISAFLIFLFVAGVILAGTFTAFDTHTPTIGIIVSTAPNQSDKSLQVHTLTLITATPTPTGMLPTQSQGSVTPPNATLTPTQGSTLPPGAGSMLCGTNLGLFNGSDSFLTSGVQSITKQQLHVTTIRMPIRSASGNSIELQAAQAIKNMGAIPLIILHESGGTADINNDKQIITQMNGIFGTSTVYYELGNEPTGGYTPYIANWNAMVSQLKTVATANSKFGGSAFFENFTSGEIAGMAQFVHTANQKPDFISWHEYTCGSTSSAQYCYDHIARWGIHIASTKQAIQANGDTVPPIFITEWNYDSAAKGVGTDPRVAQLHQLGFIQTALQELKKDGVYAAYQYVLNTNSWYNLIDSNGNALTGSGQDFATTCANL